MTQPETIPAKDIEKIADVARETLIKEIYKGIEQLKGVGGYISSQKAIQIVKDNRKKKDIIAALSKAGGKTTFVDSDVIAIMLNGLLQQILKKYLQS